MGSATANDVLLFGRVLSAEEAKQNHLVARVFPAETFLQDVLTLGRKYAKMAPESTSLSKKVHKHFVAENASCVCPLGDVCSEVIRNM